jgi:hypothetical protein
MRVVESPIAGDGAQDTPKLDTSVPQTAWIWNLSAPEIARYCAVGRKP